MARFNLKHERKKVSKVINYAGGEAYLASDHYRLVSLALTSFVTDQYYRGANEQLEELMVLVDRLDPSFVAKTAIYARREFGMRTVTHAIAAMLSLRASGQSWAKRFYDQIVVRPDDMSEIFAAYQAIGGDKMTNAMKKGFSAAFDRFDAYQIAKYRGEKKVIKLVDIVNLIHPIPTADNASALEGLVNGTLKNTETWEAQLSAAGQLKGDIVATARMRRNIWSNLLKENKLGYFALIRNLRNILQDAPGLANKVYFQLTDPDRIRKSRVLPFRLLTAYKQLKGSTAANRQVLKGLRKAMDISCRNMPVLANSLVVIDNSGSMSQPIAGSKQMKCNEVGALFGYTLAQQCNADLMEFGTTARFIPPIPGGDALSFAANFEANNQVGHGTDFSSIFDTIRSNWYDRIFIFSDMQGWIGYTTPDRAFKRYKNRTKCDPYVYSFDLTGYGNLQFPEERVRALAGFNPAIFGVLAELEGDPKALFRRIKEVAL